MTLGQTYATAPIVNGPSHTRGSLGPSATRPCRAITTNRAVLLRRAAPPGQQAATVSQRTIPATGRSTACLGFDPINSAYVQALASGIAGTGITPWGRGSVVEIDNMLG